MSLELFHTNKRLLIFAIRASELGVSFSMRLNCRKNFHSVKPAWSLLHLVLQGHVLQLWEESIKDAKRTDTQKHTIIIFNREEKYNLGIDFFSSLSLLSYLRSIFLELIFSLFLVWLYTCVIEMMTLRTDTLLIEFSLLVRQMDQLQR